MVTVRVLFCFAVPAFFVYAQEARISFRPPPTAQELIDLEARVQVNPADLDTRIALLHDYADFPRPAYRFVRLQHILYLIDHNPESQVAGTSAAYVGRSNGPYANEGDHVTAMNQWMSAIDSHSGNFTVLMNAVRFLTVEEKPAAENVLQRAIAAAPENRELGANLGFLYAAEMLSPESAAHATAALEETSSPFVLAGGGTAIPNMAMSASGGQPVDPKLFELSSRLLAKARQLARDDKDIQGPMPMINYFAEFNNQSRGITAPPPPARIRVSGNVERAQLVVKLPPEYPEAARSAGIKGDVRFNAVIGRDGTIKTLQLVSGHPLLVPAAQNAVLHWLYKPTMLNGAPVEVSTEVVVSFPPESE